MNKDTQLLGCIANLRHVRNLLKTALTNMDADLSIYSDEAMKELKQNIEKSILVCDNELSKNEYKTNKYSIS